MIGNAVVDGEQDLDALLLGLLEHLASALDPVLFLEGLTDGQALSQEEGVGHAAADDQGISGVDEVIENADLGGNLGTADDSDERGRSGSAKMPVSVSTSFSSRKPATAGR